jgi:heptosyltransferase-3/putative inorganic carbon (HCO3(-)) transporter
VGIGYGNNSFLKRYPEYDPQVQLKRNERERVLPAMHSTFAMVGLGSGLPALALFLWMFAAILIRLLNVRRAGIDADVKILVLGIAMAVLGFAVRNTFDYMFAGSLSYLFWILVAYGFALTMTRLPAQIAVR